MSIFRNHNKKAAEVQENTSETQNHAADAQNHAAETQNHAAAKSSMPKPRKKKKAVRWIVLLLIVCLGAYFGFQNYRAGQQGIQVSVISPTVGDVAETIDTSGTVQSAVSRTLYSPVGANVDSVSVEAGDTVTKGQTLVTYQTDTLERRPDNEMLQPQIHADHSQRPG